MDSRLVNEKAAAMMERSVRLSPSVIAQIGLVKRGIHLKIEEFFISCIPFELALSRASLLATLSPREIAFFQPMVGKSHKLNLIFNVPSSSKPISFFVLSDIGAFRRPNEESQYCFIDVSFRDPPFALKEILVGYFTDIDEGQGFFNDPSPVDIPPERYGLVFDRPHLSLLREGSLADRLRVVGLSKRVIRLFGEYSGSPLRAGEPLEIEGSMGEGQITFNGSCLEFSCPPELPGFAMVVVELAFHPALIARIRKVAGVR